MGEQYTLADIDLIPFVDRFAEFYPDMLNAIGDAEGRRRGSRACASGRR